MAIVAVRSWQEIGGYPENRQEDPLWQLMTLVVSYLRAVRFTPRRQGGEVGLAGTDLLEKAFHKGINFEL
jgi:hypothetical protein